MNVFIIFGLNSWYHLSALHLLAEEKTIEAVRWHKGWLGWRDAWNKLCFPAEKDALWYSFSFCFHRRPLCCRVIGFGHDDKVEHSDPAIVEVSSFLIIGLWEKNPGAFICYYTKCHNRGIKLATGHWCHLAGQKEKDYSLRVMTSVFTH